MKNLFDAICGAAAEINYMINREDQTKKDVIDVEKIDANKVFDYYFLLQDDFKFWGDMYEAVSKDKMIRVYFDEKDLLPSYEEQIAKYVFILESEYALSYKIQIKIHKKGSKSRYVFDIDSNYRYNKKEMLETLKYTKEKYKYNEADIKKYRRPTIVVS